MSPSLTSGGVEQAWTASSRPPQQVASWARPRHSHRRPTAVHQVEWIDEPGRFAELREQWDWLAARQRAPFGRHAWFSA